MITLNSLQIYNTVKMLVLRAGCVPDVTFPLAYAEITELFSHACVFATSMCSGLFLHFFIYNDFEVLLRDSFLHGQLCRSGFAKLALLTKIIYLEQNNPDFSSIGESPCRDTVRAPY